ncbi:hypothetical protein [Sorangium cellulosum]|uniref:hypothetical protein n=1 Tax=Sorangium cellulosum TaxID=56 RepID=UPI001F25869F|nr:hypothetical protein [Sorangium cellulosum]
MPTWYTSCLLFTCALTLAAIAVIARRAGGYVEHWSGLSAAFLYISLDEVVEIHEAASSWLVNPIKIAVVLKEGGHTDVVLCGYHPGSVIVVGPSAPAIGILVAAAWAVKVNVKPTVVVHDDDDDDGRVIVVHKGKGRGRWRWK